MSRDYGPIKGMRIANVGSMGLVPLDKDARQLASVVQNVIGPLQTDIQIWAESCDRITDGHADR